MSELSAKIAVLKGQMTTKDLIKKADVSRQTFRKIELGESVKLSTLRQIAEAMGVSKSEWVDLLVAWLKTEAGADRSHVWIEARNAGGDRLHDAGEDQSARALMLFQDLNNADRVEITKAMQRAEVRACLPAINRVWEKFQKPSSGQSLTESQKKILAIVKGGQSGADVPPKE